ncbi:MAG: hypothetical protein O8C66_03190 [Candidatus Methanoperedens sp.]|nr:hypothetical protein [Candidatus Methanoperedens sp.]MCZ7369492.1 hypothetical protein [Candidatus Methanoperedens sp.]
MAKYLIESPHTEEECLQALDETLGKGSDLLAKFDWGCMAGEHTGWATVEAGSESAARNMVPDFVRSKARIVKVTKFTPQQIKEAHKA